MDIDDLIIGLGERDLTELSAYADGTLPAERREAVEALLAASPELRGVVDRQRRAVAATRALAGESVPASLAASVRALRKRRSGRRLTLTLSAVGALAVVVAVALVLNLSGGPGGPSLVQAARFAMQPTSGPPPAAAPGGRALLVAVQGLRFPDLSGTFGWRAVGVRRGNLGGREATVVAYASASRRIAYVIVGGSALAPPSGGRAITVAGVRYHMLSLRGRQAVVWRRSGHTCLLTGAAPRAELLTLAQWEAGGSSSY